MKRLIDKLNKNKILTKEEFSFLIDNRDNDTELYAANIARQVCESIYGKDIYIRGLIEFSNYCKNDCFYCGIRRSNKEVERYRLTNKEILECANLGYSLGFRTFVLQGGEDPYIKDSEIALIIKTIKTNYPDCAITISAGEKSKAVYEEWFLKGADRYLLRHETASKSHYEKLHPLPLSFETRMRCLNDLKAIGYQTGTGFMVGSPFQKSSDLALDLLFIADFKPEMIGIGPFIPHHATKFANFPHGTVSLTVFLLSLLRIMLPYVLLPATTALGTIDEEGREKGILAGANVVMPNLSPPSFRKKYSLYDNKLATGVEAAENIKSLQNLMKKIDRNIIVARGDVKTRR